eukprot:3041781-Rhodomonas_salina.3
MPDVSAQIPCTYAPELSTKITSHRTPDVSTCVQGPVEPYPVSEFAWATRVRSIILQYQYGDSAEPYPTSTSYPQFLV